MPEENNQICQICQITVISDTELMSSKGPGNMPVITFTVNAQVDIEFF